jgi:hypothetical protein
VLLNDIEDDDDEGSRRPADLEATATKGGDEKPGDDGREQSLVRCRPRCDGERHRKRQGHDRNREARDGIASQIG